MAISVMSCSPEPRGGTPYQRRLATEPCHGCGKQLVLRPGPDAALDTLVDKYLHRRHLCGLLLIAPDQSRM